MKGIICYYSGSGNTKLACEYIKNKISSVDFELYNVVKSEIPNFNEYEIVGFTTFTDFCGVPTYFCSFLDKIKPQQNKFTFVFNTYGFMPGAALRSLEEVVKSRGFNILIGHSLHTPESYPPQRVRGLPADNSPKKRGLVRFNNFISKLESQLKSIKENKDPDKEEIKIGFLNSFLPKYSRAKAKQDMGEQKVNETLCVECGTCQRNCPVEAIKLAPKPVFDHSKCCGCWACYNHCPQKAIYTKKLRGKGQYPRPSKQLMEKLAVY